MRITEALNWAEDKQRIMTQYRYRFTALDLEQNALCITALEKQVGKEAVNGNLECGNCREDIFPSEKFCSQCGYRIIRTEVKS